MAEGPPVIIFGAHIAALGVLRVLTRHGVTCYVADDTSDIISRSRWRRALEPTLAETTDSAIVAEYLEGLSVPSAVIIACSDRWSLGLSGIPHSLRQRFPSSLPERNAIEQFVDKDKFRALVERLGIPHPRAIPLRTVDDLDLATDAELTSGFLKPTDSPRHKVHFHTKGAFVDSRESASRIVERGAKVGIEFMLQEWIPGPMGATILIDGFFDRTGTIVAMLARRRIRMNPPRIGNTVSAVTIPLEEVEEPIGALRRLFADVGYRGVFNAEFKRDERDGTYKIIEINARPAWFIGTIASIGVDLPWMNYLDAQDLPVPAPPPYRAGRYTLYELQDAAAMIRSVRSRRRPLGPILGPWLRGDRAMFWWRDPGPAIGGAGRAVGRRVLGAFGRARPTAS